MVSGAVGLKAAVAVAVLAVLLMSSQGHPRKKDCASQCYNNCTAIAAVLQACCQNVCSSNGATSSLSCCPNGTSSVTCNCDNCNIAVQNVCATTCSNLRCEACKDRITKECNESCIGACNDHCVKKDC
ncbi:hypothetical protein SETIT_8G169600v2 [Setaria italica]|uniref:Uncharacterized protein n=2 Tax=Setaria TaxID=4554 RepID=A0A368S8T9_SETIT|nr:hypothetical protein SETIT_8G169600v2 [Setaria italica]TKW01420.1 hypothetical protein SEVIR_8G179100v2 [Setaria viridis]